MSSGETVWISDGRWRRLPPSVRSALLRLRPRLDWLQQSGGAAWEWLCEAGEHDTAIALLQALAADSRPPGRPAGVNEREWVSVEVSTEMRDELRAEARRRGVAVRRVVEERLRR